MPEDNPFTTFTTSEGIPRTGVNPIAEEPNADPLSVMQDMLNNILEGEEEQPEQIESVLKKQHLNRSMRRALHRPAKDWIQKGDQEVCRNSCVLDVSDIIERIT